VTDCIKIAKNMLETYSHINRWSYIKFVYIFYSLSILSAHLLQAAIAILSHCRVYGV